MQSTMSTFSPMRPRRLSDLSGTPAFLSQHLSAFSSLSSSTTSNSLNPSLTDRLYSSLHFILSTMTGGSNDTCLANCSGRGECLQGTCLCQVQYHGSTCTDPNLAYFVSFASIFYLIAFVSFAQLLVCVRSEYMRMKTPSLRRACAVTTQKMLYVITCMAAVLRGAYFSSPSNADLLLSASFMSAFYPIILTAGSLIVCFWAEAFHLRDIRCERPRFLSKSFCGFLIFNIVTYSLFLSEIILTKSTPTQEERSFLSHVFSGCYAVLLFIVVVFFLIYGVEVYFKVRGGFLSDTIIVGRVQSRSDRAGKDDEGGSVPEPLLHDEANEMKISEDKPNLSVSSATVVATTSSSSSPAAGSYPLVSGLPSRSFERVKKGFKQKKHPDSESEFSEQLLNQGELKVEFSGLIPERGIDHSQLHQSRFGLVFQACMLMITVCFLCSDVLGGFWKNKVPLMSRNAYDIIFRVVELAVALWFPCVLWNCISPEQLWILNPRKILKKLDFEKTLELGEVIGAEGINKNDAGGECWICYDSEAVTAGPMINPCDCKGDVGAVHHNCLRKWLMECAPNNSTEKLCCKVCGSQYQLEQKNIWWIGKGFTARQWLQTASIVTIMCGTIAGFWATMQLCEDAFTRALAAGGTLIIIYICLRSLGFSFFTGYQRAKISAVKILSGKFSSSTSSSASTSSAVATVLPVQALGETRTVTRMQLVQDDSAESPVEEIPSLTLPLCDAGT